MPEGLDEAQSAFERAIDPSPKHDAPTQPRDQAGKFVSTAEKPEPFLQVRMLEGDPDTGDTSDAGDDPRLRAREREIADGRFDERAERAEREGVAAKVQRESDDDSAAVRPEHKAADDEQGDAEGAGAGDEEGSDEGAEEAADDEAQYEITVDGQPQTVSLSELRDGYIRTATFHSRFNKVQEYKAQVDQESTRVGQLRDLYINGLQFLDQDLQALVPKEPNWDEEYARDPAAARRRQKEFEAYNGKLVQIRANRNWAIQNQREEHDRAAAKYAVDQFTEFVQEHPKLFRDETSIQRVVSGMRQVALAHGFNETEVAGVYDKRMLNVLLESWLYRQGMAVKPKAIAAPGPGKTLVPGSARPMNGSVVRRNIDEAQRQLARTGRLEDAAAFFQRLLR